MFTRCPHCKTKYDVTRDGVGQTVNCETCHKNFVVEESLSDAKIYLLNVLRYAFHFIAALFILGGALCLFGGCASGDYDPMTAMVKYLRVIAGIVSIWFGIYINGLVNRTFG